jgi:hypothetical protein
MTCDLNKQTVLIMGVGRGVGTEAAASAVCTRS